MPHHASDSPRTPHPARRWLKLAAVAVVLIAAAYALWRWANDMAGVRRDAPKVTAIIPLPPPPPPPPEPEKPPEPEPPKEDPVATPEPEPQPTPEPPKPQDEAPPRPADDLANPMQIDGDAQAGSDAFNIGAGQGKGMAGGGGGRAGNATYSQYLAYALQKILREDERTRNLTFRLQANIWLTASGQITRVELTRSSGDADVDARVVAALRAVPGLDERPPASASMPIRASLTGRRPS
ncbi:TonB C-terminal domain-containing protein [Achromobacter ruhlandii]|uniref:TonB C-terminal domain-containing protein n=1 Tax=Achromobacter ruhlandii TaxID=72557 RepID=UPI0007BF3F9B|nr:TonB C-terminal domain-containing protein [Achromobacter ruhlandii]